MTNETSLASVGEGAISRHKEINRLRALVLRHLSFDEAVWASHVIEELVAATARVAALEAALRRIAHERDDQIAWDALATPQTAGDEDGYWDNPRPCPECGEPVPCAH